ncbi:Uncharacterised protein [Bifidobacterium catenulatum]|nr:hypothetical protein [Bifidobacterium catenulatum]VUX31590.1 Uncharacterised protein [Bifidobacterium catenulatum]
MASSLNELPWEDSRAERDEDLEFAKLIDTKAQPLFDEEYQ